MLGDMDQVSGRNFEKGGCMAPNFALFRSFCARHRLKNKTLKGNENEKSLRN